VKDLAACDQILHFVQDDRCVAAFSSGGVIPSYQEWPLTRVDENAVESAHIVILSGA
jgi:hypothetical protein